MYHFKAFCWILDNIIDNDLARECEDRLFPWDYGSVGVDGLPIPPIVDLRGDHKLWPTFVLSPDILDSFIWHCSYWFVTLCRNPVFKLYRAGIELGIGVRLRERENGGSWTVDQVRTALFMAVQEVEHHEDFLIFVYAKFPSLYQTSHMGRHGNGWLPFGPGMFVNSVYPKELESAKWHYTTRKVTANNKGM